MLAKLALFLVAPYLLLRVKGRYALRYRYALDTRSYSAIPVNTGKKQFFCFFPIFQLILNPVLTLRSWLRLLVHLG